MSEMDTVLAEQLRCRDYVIENGRDPGAPRNKLWGGKPPLSPIRRMK